jgi:excisionase family DNA binding protein
MTEAIAPAEQAAYLKVSEVATRLNVSKRHVYDLISARELESARFGNGHLGLRVIRVSLDAFELRRREGPPV